MGSTRVLPLPGQHSGARDLKCLLGFMEEKKTERGFVVTKSPDDMGPLEFDGAAKTRIMRVPAPLPCYWLGQA